MTLRKRCGILLCTLTLLFSSGCSVFMAAKQPGLKNVALFKAGTPRSLLLAEFGSPVSDLRDGKKYEIFAFRQGYSTGAKAGRAFFHGAADVMTLGLWEIIGTPTESIFNGNEMAFEVSYDENNKIDQVVALKGAAETAQDLANIQEQSGHPQYSGGDKSQTQEKALAPELVFESSPPRADGSIELSGKVISSASISEISINGREVPLAKDGSFKVLRLPPMGTTTYRLSVADEFGQRANAEINVERKAILLAEEVEPLNPRKTKDFPR